VNASADPVKVVIIDMGSSSDLDVSSADMLIALHKELRQRNVRFTLSQMIAPVSEILERADARNEIGERDIYHSTVEAFTDYFVSRPAIPQVKRCYISGCWNRANRFKHACSPCPLNARLFSPKSWKLSIRKSKRSKANKEQR